MVCQQLQRVCVCALTGLEYGSIHSINLLTGHQRNLQIKL